MSEQRTRSAGLENDLRDAVDDLKREKDTSKEFARDASEQVI